MRKVEFLLLVAAALEQYAGLDHSRRYVVGMSNGAGMAHKLAIEAGTAFRLRAFAAVVTSLVEGNLPRPESCTPSVLQIEGEDDALVPIDGGKGVAGHVFLAADASARVWAEHCGCQDGVETLLDAGTRKTLYPAAEAGGAEILSYRVKAREDGEKHRGPHGAVPDDLEGSLTDLIWSFLSSH